MSTKPILSNLVFTRSIGHRHSVNDHAFDDASQYGGFPADFTIRGIKKISVFSDKTKGDDAVITGLTIEYYGVDEDVSHGMVVGVNKVGTVEIDSKKHVIVGAYGRLKDLPESKLDKRIASIGFVVYDKVVGSISSKGPWNGTTEYLGTPWATFGPVVAFQGTTKDGIGLTTLGFVKTLDGLPGDNINIVETGPFMNFFAIPNAIEEVIYL